MFNIHIIDGIFPNNNDPGSPAREGYLYVVHLYKLWNSDSKISEAIVEAKIFTYYTMVLKTSHA